MRRSLSFISGPLSDGFKRAGHEVLDLLLPARCQLCDAAASSRYARVLCDDCGADWPFYRSGCSRCGRPATEGASTDPSPETCSDCLSSPPPYGRARSLTLYEGKVVEAIQALKYHGRRGLAPLLGQWMADALPEMFGDTEYRAIVPIPLHWRRRWWRGYNQAELIAQPVAAVLKVPLELELKRRRSTQRQVKLGLEERQLNLAEAFSVPPAAARRIKDGNVLIVDDVFTTGATTGACARSLLEAGARRVDVLTLARTA